jgi:NAD+ synthetase
MKIALAQINPIIGDFRYNCNQIIAYAAKARQQDCDLVVFSEMVICGYPPRDLLERSDFIATNQRWLDHLLARIEGIGVLCGTIEPNRGDHGNPLHNAAVLFEDGRILHRAHKRLLPTYDVFDERRYFEPGTDCQAFIYRDHRLGVTVCEDVWTDMANFATRLYDTNPVDRLVADGADLIVNVSASPYHIGKQEHRRQLLSDIAVRHGVPVVYVNQVGGNDSVLFDGSSCCFDRQGRLVARAADFQQDLVCFDSAAEQPALEQIHAVATDPSASLLAALAMGTRDYVRKCGFSRAVIGLSGGIDSALTACVAQQALGAENVLTVFMPSRYTAQDNYGDTAALARNLGVAYEVVPIDAMVKVIGEGIALEADTADVTAQNLQARIRGTILMAYSNRGGYLLLATGNKSEMAVGYCTLYGDMNGSLAVIADVPKIVVYQLAEYINRNQEIIPRNILTKAPSAELKPDQTDQDDLPPYETLDAILGAYIEDNLAPDDIVRQGYPAALVQDIVNRVMHNEHKRHQAPPGLKVSVKAFGYGRRYPLAQRYRPHTSIN